jgi:anaerobic magnesium-protoporphyrin IX monomethyl ester cyclase
LSVRNAVKRILLINPPVQVKQSWADDVGSFPLGLSFIAAVLERNHFEVKILDCFIEGFFNRRAVDGRLIRIGMSDDEIIKAIVEYSPDLVGIAVQFSCQLSSALHLNSVVKKINTGVVTVAGGNHASAAPESLGRGTFDWIVVGEGEFRLLGLIQAINDQNIGAAVPGVFSTSGPPSRDVPVAVGGFIEDLDSLPFPSYGLLPLEKYWRIRGDTRWINMIATRGCPYHCVFCSIKTIMGKRVRTRSVDSVLEELIHLKREFQVRQIYFEDDNLTCNIRWAKELFRKIIREELGMEYFFRNGIRADRVDLELLKLMKKAGTRRVCFAPESGSQKTLDTVIRKNMRLEDCEKAVRMARRAGLDVTCFLVIGFPEETLEDIRKTVQYGRRLRRLGCDRIWLSCAVPYPGTELFENCVRRGILSRDEIDYQSMSTMDSIIHNEWFTAEEVKRIRDQAMTDLNRRHFRDFLRVAPRRASLLISNPSLFTRRLLAYAGKSRFTRKRPPAAQD